MLMAYPADRDPAAVYLQAQSAGRLRASEQLESQSALTCAMGHLMSMSVRRRFFLLVAVTLIAVTGKTDAQESEEVCRTPDSQDGVCVVVKDCRPFVDFLAKTKRPFSLEVRDRLKKYTCGFETGSVKVCCPPGPISLTSTSVVVADTPPDVSSHRNYRLLPKNCGVAGSEDKIVNGDDATLGEFPWMALLAYKTSNGLKFRCGGSIINKNYILTAAHCITNLGDPLWSVRVGEHDLTKEVDCEVGSNRKTRCSSPVQNIGVLEVIPHEKFGVGGRWSNDIGLLRVSTIDFSKENVKPICMPLEAEAKQDLKDKSIVVTGWGVTENLTTSDILQRVEIPVVSPSSCQNAYKIYEIELNNRQMCAGGGSKDTCGGDSGGPLQLPAYLFDEVRFVQYAIVSFGGSLCGKNALPKVFTRTESYLDWMLDNMRS